MTGEKTSFEESQEKLIQKIEDFLYHDFAIIGESKTVVSKIMELIKPFISLRTDHNKHTDDVLFDLESAVNKLPTIKIGLPKQDQEDYIVKQDVLEMISVFVSTREINELNH